MISRMFWGMTAIVLWGFWGSLEANASRKADIIRRLNEQDRLEEGRSYCDKWLLEENPATDLRESCAHVFFRGVDVHSVQSWQDFRARWNGTSAAENARDPMVRQMLLSLAGEGSKEKYEELEALALDASLKKECYSAGVKSALKKVSSTEEAKKLALELGGKEEVSILFERFPQVFFSVKVEGERIQLTEEISVFGKKEAIKTQWARRCGETVQIWDDVVKESLIAQGIPNSHVMSKIQKSEGTGSSFPLCPLLGQDSSCVLGVSITIKKHTAFIPQSWSNQCDVQPVLMSFTKLRLRSISLKENHLVELVNPLYNEEKLTGNTASFTKLKKKPYIDEAKIYSEHNNAYLVYPIDGNPPFLTEKPPSTWKLMMGKDFNGVEIPKKWTVRTNDGISVDMGAAGERTLPSGELRIFSPQASLLLGLNTIEPVALTEPSISWAKQKPPKEASPLDVEALDAAAINKASTQLFAAGFDASEIEVYDGWAIDLDSDKEEERILRLSINNREALAVLDYTEVDGPKTYLFETNHAIHGTTRAPVPRAFLLDKLVVFYWMGKEEQVRYADWVFPFGTGYKLSHKEF